jgi:hypothetical protein
MPVSPKWSLYLFMVYLKMVSADQTLWHLMVHRAGWCSGKVMDLYQGRPRFEPGLGYWGLRCFLSFILRRFHKTTSTLPRSLLSKSFPIRESLDHSTLSLHSLTYCQHHKINHKTHQINLPLFSSIIYVFLLASSSPQSFFRVAKRVSSD